MSLRSLSDSQILSRIQDLTRRERELTLLVLLHLNEIERRRLHLKLGYSSLFEYCTSKLGYSASAAVRRIRTARCIARFPRAYDLLQRNEVNLSTIAQVSRVLTSDNHEKLLSRIRGKSQREVEAIVAEHQPCAMPRDLVRTIVVTPARGVLESGFAAGKESPIGAMKDACEKSAYHRSGCECEDAASGEPATVPPAPTTAREQVETRTLLQFSVGKEFMYKLNKIRSLAWHRLPANASLEQVFELALDLVIEKEDPAKRIERREKRKKPDGRESSNRPAGNSRSESHARHVSAPVRDKVFKRDGGRCTFVGAGGRRCGATCALQVDHITPVARGGADTPDNLRLLCAYHNRIEAERVLGFAATKATRAGNHRRMPGNSHHSAGCLDVAPVRLDPGGDNRLSAFADPKLTNP